MIAYGNTEEELENTLLLSDMCSEYDLSSDPILPRFDCPEGMSSEEYLLSLLREGWIKLYPKLKRVMEEKKIEEEVYVKRIKYEIKTLTDAGLSDYFLIVRDFILKAREEGQLTGPGRGSAAGSLALYLLGVTHVDPIEYNLLFERFYNNARNVPRHISFDEYSFLKHIGA
jgi:DNA polymerase-3 subunit alpha